MMGEELGASLLEADEPPAVRIENPQGKAPFLLTADHAGRLIPRVLGNLGLDEAELRRHIAWDIGIAGVTTRLAVMLNATAILQTYSRLVIDCNRQPHLPNAFPAVSEATAIPGNQGLSEAGKQARRAAIFEPYHREIAQAIAARGAARPIYVAMHSFTPVYLGRARPMHVAVLYNRNPHLSRRLAALLRAEGDLNVSENEPYQVSDETDFGVPVHAERAGLDYLEIEIRQDLIENEAEQTDWAVRLARLLPAAAGLDRGG
jgi:predicted N-formylglutamate amidohydrolase